MYFGLHATTQFSVTISDKLSEKSSRWNVRKQIWTNINDWKYNKLAKSLPKMLAALIKVSSDKRCVAKHRAELGTFGIFEFFQ